jgi:integrase
VGEAIDAYELYMRDDKGNKPVSVTETTRRLRRFFPQHDLLLASVDEKRASAYYEARWTKKDGQPISVDYHRNTLAEARSFLKWCVVKKKWLDRNPFEGVEGVGRRKHGKPQLRIDEARRWLDAAMHIAEQDEAGAVAAMLTLLLGLRASEVVRRVVRDIDDGGRLLWIPGGKTAAARRTLEVPNLMRPYLRELIEGKQPLDLVFGYHDRGWVREWVQRICKVAGVPVVSAHGMRGLHSTLAVDAGITSHAVASALGHESFSTTSQSYARPEALDRARQARVLGALRNEIPSFVPAAFSGNEEGFAGSC